MSLGRRKISVQDASAWIFNRMAEVYAARPAYPDALVDALAALAVAARQSSDSVGLAAAADDARGARAVIGDLGAGIGHLALPLAARGFDVVAVDPAELMLERLRTDAAQRGLAVRTLHAAAEQLPLGNGMLDLVVAADALHFFDRQLAAHEIRRVLAPYGALALVTCGFADTPFMRGVRHAMEEAAPRRPRALAQSLEQVSAITGIALHTEMQFQDDLPVDPATLDRILSSISFIGPAMKPERFEKFRQRVRQLPGPAVWARVFTLRAGRRMPSSRVRIEAERRKGRP